SALAVLKVERHIGIDTDLHPHHTLIVDGDGELAHDIQAHALRRLDQPGALAVGAVKVDAALQAGTHELAGHLDDAELAHAQDLALGPVLLEVLLRALFELAAVALVAQVDAVADDLTAQVTQLELAAGLIGVLQVGLEGGGFGVGVRAEVAAVDIG